MHVRVVRFTDVDQERLDGLKARIAEGDGPPEGVISTGVKFIHDPAQQTMIVIQEFASEEDMVESEKVFEAMDSGQTPGTRASVDRGTIVAELNA